VPKPKTLQAFTADERDRVHTLLGIKVAHMMGRKFEEGDWAAIYCKAKNIPNMGWSNLNIDIMHKNLGVEHKMLCVRSKPDLASVCGLTCMHPSATRSIRVPSTDTDPNEAMEDILTQYADLIAARRAKVEEQNDTGLPVDMRTGWLLWQESLRQFLYFEEEMLPPDPKEFQAEWVGNVESGGGIRKGSKNLWVYEKSTGRKRYSITTSAGAKIQPYFDVPPPDDPNLYLFTVIGEQIRVGVIRIWLTSATARELEIILGNLDVETVSNAIIDVISNVEAPAATEDKEIEHGTSITIREDAYKALVSALPAVSDEHCFQLLIEYIKNSHS
jgi:hypothetical protein